MDGVPHSKPDLLELSSLGASVPHQALTTEQPKTSVSTVAALNIPDGSMPSTSITVGSNNMQNNYYNFYPGTIPTLDSPLSAPSANEPINRLSRQPPPNTDMQSFRGRLGPIREDAESQSYNSTDGPTGQSHTSNPSSEAAPSIMSQKSTKTTKDSKKFLYMTRLQDLEFSKSLPGHMQTYTKALSIELASSYHTVCLWDPFPNKNLPHHLQEMYCTLGDVGMFDAYGGFEVFFNIYMTREENLQMRYHPPEGFRPLDFTTSQDDSRSFQEDNTQFLTKDFRQFKEVDDQSGRASFTFQSIRKPRGSGGAILALPDGYKKTHIGNKGITQINKHLRTDIEKWYSKENHWNEGDILPNGALKLITSCYKSPIWGAGVLPQDRYKPGIPPVTMERRKHQDMYKWNAPEAPIRINHGSTKRNARNIRYTIAIEVMSVYRPESTSRNRSIFSFRSKNTTSSKLSLREIIAPSGPLKNSSRRWLPSR